MKQVENGKAFEYSIAKNYYDYLANQGLNVQLIENRSLSIARGFYEQASDIEKDSFDSAAYNTIQTLTYIEPGLSSQKDVDDKLQITIADDKQGQAGDVRDVVFRRGNNQIYWEIGISAKNNHEAVKHSRLSPTIDFGHEWLGHQCGSGYFENINKIFDLIRQYKDSNITEWHQIGNDKETLIYQPILMAFKDELLRLATLHSDVPSMLLQYLIGRYPFYKVIKDDRNNLVIVKAFNLGGKLNESINGTKPRVKTERIKYPSRIIELAFKEQSSNTLMMVMDEGWQISFRIHNASKSLETSLKFDINLIGNPPVLFSQHLFAH